MTKQNLNVSRGYTLVELMLATGLSAIVLTGVLSTFLYLSRSGTTLANYNDMELQSRKGIETFAEDIRQAKTITWNTAQSITIVVPKGGSAVSISYTYDSTTRAFSRIHATEGTKVLITGITPNTFVFRAFKLNGDSLSLDNAADLLDATKSTKQLQISLEVYRSRSLLATTTNKVLSARYILRNRIVAA